MLAQAILAVAFAVGLVAAQDQTYQLFINDQDQGAKFKASIIGACANTTTYAVLCTSGSPMNEACSAGATTMTITEAATTYIATTEGIVSETSATVTVACSLDTAASIASCSQTVNANGYGVENAVTNYYNLTSSSYYQYAVTATAGVHKLDNVKNNAKACKTASSQSGAASATVHGTAAMGVVVLTILGMAIML